MVTADLKAKALDIFSAALDASHPSRLMHEALRLQGTVLTVHGLQVETLEIDLSGIGRVVVVGAGKATAPMAASLEELLGDRLEGGVISVKYGHAVPLERLSVDCDAKSSPSSGSRSVKRGTRFPTRTAWRPRLKSSTCCEVWGRTTLRSC